MQQNRTRDVAVGIFVLAGLAAIGYLSLRVGGFSLAAGSTLDIYARFDEIGGLQTRAPVVISGVQVGRVESIELGEDYRALVGLQLGGDLQLPIDTSASIVTSGVLGDRYISLQLGGEDIYLEDGEEIQFVESAVLLERLIGKLIHDADVGGD